MVYSVGRFMNLLENDGSDRAMSYYLKNVDRVGLFRRSQNVGLVNSVYTICALERKHASEGISFAAHAKLGTSRQVLDHVVSNLSTVADLDNGRYLIEELN